MEYDGQRWRKDDLSTPQRLAMESVKLLRDYLPRIGRPSEREDFVRAVRRAESRRAIDAIVNVAQANELIAVRPQAFDQDHFILNCLNGTLDLKTGKLRSHDPADIVTKLAPVNYVETAACPIWERFLERVMAEKGEMIAFIQRALGYALTGSTREECRFVFYGLGQNGKSKLLGAAESIAGDYAGVSENHLLTLKIQSEHPTAIAHLAGKRLVLVPEPNQCQFDDARVKWLTGGDTITSRKMNQDFSDFKLACKFFVMSNHKPKFQDLSDGSIELPSDIVTLLSGLQASINDMRAELTAVHAELRTKPAGPAVPRKGYSVEEVAELLGKGSYTIREWCRLGRINATKREERRGGAALWSICADELDRYRNEGLLPIDPERNNAN